MVEQGVLKRINVDKLDLDLENPRHGKLLTPEAAITHLIEKERVIELAIDIAKKGGTNPMDLLGVFKRKGTAKSEFYVAAEGNRRVCAMMLLHDPDKVPKGVVDRAKRVKALENAASMADLPASVNCVVFASKKDAMPWISLMHIADQDGRARKRWTPDQQANAMEDAGRNSDAMQVLDVAENFGLITKTDRDLKLTTVQRYLSNPTMRSALGLERQKDRTLAVTVAQGEFSKLFEAFLEGVRNGKLSSRSDSKAVNLYATKLAAEVPCDRTPVTPYPLSKYSVPDQQQADPIEQEVTDAVAEVVVPDQPQTLGPLPKSSARTVLGRKAEVEAALFPLSNDKLTSLYTSCVSLPLKDHTPLITVGLWSFFESISSLHAGKETQFVLYLNTNNMDHKFGISEPNQRKAMRAAIDRLSVAGNATKHNPIAGSFSGLQLANDFDVLAPLVVAICSSMPQ